MSQSLLLLRQKLQSPERKIQSAQWTSEQKSWFKPKSRSDQIDSLVLVCTWLLCSGGCDSRTLYGKVHSYCGLLLNSNIRLTDYPCTSEIHKYPSAVVCTCGNVLAFGGQNWGLVHHCSKCKQPHWGKRYYLPMFTSGIEKAGFAFVISKEWCEWAQVQAILLLTKQFNLEGPHRNSVTGPGE